jgi:HAD superfamily hydrolase (TIGR01509 family)
MTPLDLMRNRKALLRLVIFDCDGVIVDSEPIANRVTVTELATLGWTMTAAESERRFLGMTFSDMVPVIERQLGHAIPPAWHDTVKARLIEALALEAIPIAGALEALAALSALGVPWRIASNSSHEEMDAKFARIGIAAVVAGRMHSHRDVKQGKPAPDLFLAAAAAEGVAPAECMVIEDSQPGVRAAVAAGMDCLGYAPHSDGAALRALGAVPFRSMFDVPALVAAARRETS